MARQELLVECALKKARKSYSREEKLNALVDVMTSNDTLYNALFHIAIETQFLTPRGRWPRFKCLHPAPVLLSAQSLLSAYYLLSA